jgi:hypothetical protein
MKGGTTIGGAEMRDADVGRDGGDRKGRDEIDV